MHSARQPHFRIGGEVYWLYAPFAQSPPAGVKPSDPLGRVDRTAPSDANDRSCSDPLGHSSRLVYPVGCGIGALCREHRAVDTDLPTANGRDCCKPRRRQRDHLLILLVMLALQRGEQCPHVEQTMYPHLRI